MANLLELSPFAVVIIITGMAAWTELWGMPRAFLTVPSTAIMTIVASRIQGTRPVAALPSKSGRI
jgi:predicted PurR-regulated permease PerM